MLAMHRLVLLALALTAFTGLAAFQISAAQTPELQRRAFVPMVARDEGLPTPVNTRRPPPPPGPGYCISSGPGVPTPPNAVFGLLTINGAPAPAETLVGLTFDGKVGPYEYTVQAGGYRVFYAAGGQGQDPPCINQVGAVIGLLVNGVHFSSGRAVGDPGPEGLALPFHVAIP